MSKNVYDIYRDIQNIRKNCNDERSAAFIVDGEMAQTVYHKRLKKDIPAALVFGHKEGPDDITVYSLIEDDLLKSDYFIWKNTDYLVYEENKITNNEINFRKQRALECNVSFTYQDQTFIGYYKSALRGNDNPRFLGGNVVVPEETPLLVLPTNNSIDVKSEFVIEGKPFVVTEYDHITNKGITYYYLERGTIKKVKGTPETIEEVVVVDNSEIIDQTDDLDEPTLKAMMEYEFETEGALFSATPAVEIISRTLKQIRFRVPFGINQVTITTKKDGLSVEKTYKVVV